MMADVQAGDVAIRCHHLDAEVVRRGGHGTHWYSATDLDEEPILLPLKGGGKTAIRWLVCCDDCDRLLDEEDGEADFLTDPIVMSRGYDFYYPN